MAAARGSTIVKFSEPNVRKISSTPSRNPKSPMRLTQNALFPAFVADCFRKKKPISR